MEFMDGLHLSRRSTMSQNDNSPPDVYALDIALRKSKDRKHRLGLFRQWIASIFISTSYLIIGTSVGWPSPVLYNMTKTGEPINLTTTDISVMVSLFYVGNIVMPIPSGILSDHKGRKYCLSMLAVIPLTSWILTYFAINPIMLHVARLLAGMWGGLVRTVVPLYIAEIAEPGARGGMSVLATILVNLGILMAYVFGRFVSYWTLAVIFGCIPVVFFAMIIAIPESPYWLIYKGTERKAAKSLAWLRGCKDEKDVEEEVGRLSLAVNSDLQKPKGVHNLVVSKANRKALIIVEVLSIGQRLTGIGAVVAYAAISLPDKKVGMLNPNECVIVIGVARLVTVTVIILIIDRFGRIPLLIISCGGCGLSMFVACVWFYNNQLVKEYLPGWIPFAAFLFYGCFFNVGIGPIPTTIQGELFPAHLKGIASAITAIILASTSAVVNLCYLQIAENVGMFVNFAIYTLTCIGCIVFISTYVFETKGKTLHEIQQHLQGQRDTSNTN